jgi:UDP-N-acetylmuramate: L-alanyl-gamma-D-glutamyl-meso-diaminopimelate ligase
VYVGLVYADVVSIASIELVQIYIYPDPSAYEAAFRALVARVPETGVLVCDARDPRVRAVVAGAKARVIYYALEGDDTGDVTPSWLGATVAMDDAGMQPFDLFAGGVSCGRFALRVPAIAACAEGFGVPISTARTALLTFDGVRRRQDLIGEPGGVRVYDDFAHHPTAVDETLRALRAKHPKGALWAVFEPRSATACRALHQETYVGAFGAADRVLLAPLGRTNIPAGERLDLEKLAGALGGKAEATPSMDASLKQVRAGVQPGDTVALLSNGAFGGLPDRLLSSLGRRGASR